MAFRPWIRLVAPGLVTLTVLLSGPARAGLAPVVPPLAFSWGTSGSVAGQFQQPQGMAADADGNVYVADLLNNRVQKFDALGNCIWTIGSLGVFNGQFNGPIAVALDRDGFLYVLDRNNGRVEKFTSAGAYVSQFFLQTSFPEGHDLAINPKTGSIWEVELGQGRDYDKNGVALGNTGSGFSVTAIAVDSRGMTYLGRQNFIDVRDASFHTIASWGSSGTGDGQFTSIGRIAFDPVGNVYVLDSGSKRIQKFTRDGAFLGKWAIPGSGDINSVNPGMAIDPAGNVYVSNPQGNQVQKFVGAGAVPAFPAPIAWDQWGVLGSGPMNLNGPVGIACRGNVFYVADQLNHRVQSVAISGGSLFLLNNWGTAGTGNGQFQQPFGVTTDPTGDVYVSDPTLNRVQRFSSNGLYVLQWGTPGSAAGAFSGAGGLASDVSGNIYVADIGNSRVQEFVGDGTYITSWGTFGSGPGQFDFPVAVAVDAFGYVYVVDQANGRVEKFTSSGVFVLQWGSPGSGDGQFLQPEGIAVDANGNVVVVDSQNQRMQLFTSNGLFLAKFGTAGSGLGQVNVPATACFDATGNLYVTDTGNSRVVEYASVPRIVMTSDVGNDQGRKTRVTLARTTGDAPGLAGGEIGLYRIFVRDDSLGTWVQSVDVPATGDATYSVLATVNTNASASSYFFTNFRVIALPVSFLNPAIEGGTAWGLAVDNLSPPPPTGFAAQAAGLAARLSWDPSPAADFATYRLYRGASADFVPSADNRVAETTRSEFVDPDPAAFYKLSVVDRNGNESEDAVAVVTPDPGPIVFALRGARQNPITGQQLDVAFSLAHAGDARLELFDVSGRRVAGRDVGALGTGWHAVDLAGGTRVASGIYYIRLRQGADVATASVVVLH